MNKVLVSSLVALIAFGAQVASAQVYYPTATYSGSYSGACLNVSGNLSYGVSSPQVTQLQTFLVAQNYPGEGSWMETGYFGSATVQALRDFQQAQGLPTSGSVDAATASAIARITCGSSAYTSPSLYNYTAPTYSYVPPVSTIPYTNYTPTTYIPSPTCTNYPYTCTTYTYGNGTGSVALTSLSQNTGAPGTQVTVYGTGFDPSNNTIYFGTQVLSGIPSNGNSLTFTVPSYYATGLYGVNQSVQFYVTDSQGTSNSLGFTVTTYGYGYGGCSQTGSYYSPYNSYGSSCGCQSGQGIPAGYNTYYGSSSCYTQPTNNLTSPTISYINPTSGGVGASVTVIGTGFSTNNNTVHFGQGIISNLQSSDGQSVSFTVPAQLTGFGSQVLVLGSYNLSVTNSSGYTTNAVPFVVTSLISGGGAPTITGVNGPTSLAVGATGTWAVTINNPSNSSVSTSVTWGDTGNGYVNQAAPQITYTPGSATLTFTHAYFTGGTYPITFTVSNSNGQQNTTTATVYVSGSTSGTLTLSYLTPSTGNVGTQVMLQGTGFSSLDNTVHFGAGGTQHVPSSNGTTLYYTIPAYVSPCDVIASGQVCAQYIQQVTTGSYPIFVTNSNGTSQTLNFQVQ